MGFSYNQPGAILPIDLTSQVANTLPVANGGTGLAALGAALEHLRVNAAALALEYAVEGGWVELANVDLSGGANAEINSGVITARRYLMIIFFGDQTVDSDFLLRFNADAGANYARSYSSDAGGNVGQTGQTQIALVSNPAGIELFCWMVFYNDATEEKLGNMLYSRQNETRTEQMGVWTNVVDQITRVTVTSGAGVLGTKTHLIVMGRD